MLTNSKSLQSCTTLYLHWCHAKVSVLSTNPPKALKYWQIPDICISCCKSWKNIGQYHIIQNNVVADTKWTCNKWDLLDFCYHQPEEGSWELLKRGRLYDFFSYCSVQNIFSINEKQIKLAERQVIINRSWWQQQKRLPVYSIGTT